MKKSERIARKLVVHSLRRWLFYERNFTKFDKRYNELSNELRQSKLKVATNGK